MAYKRLSLDRAENGELIIERLKRFGESFKFSDDLSLEAYEMAVKEVRIAIERKNTKLAEVDLETELVNAALDKEDKIQTALRGCIGNAKGKNSDAFVAIGGTRQSDIIEAQQQAREEKKKMREEKMKKDEEDKK